eukprot:SAG11_NODE_7_length_31267_cov_19.541966_35_plen_88_part_00
MADTRTRAEPGTTVVEAALAANRAERAQSVARSPLVSSLAAKMPPVAKSRAATALPARSRAETPAVAVVRPSRRQRTRWGCRMAPAS